MFLAALQSDVLQREKTRAVATVPMKVAFCDGLSVLFFFVIHFTSLHPISPDLLRRQLNRSHALDNDFCF